MTFLLSFAALYLIMMSGFTEAGAQSQLIDVKGAWQSDALEYRSTMICSERFFAVAIYDAKNKKFIGTHGGSYRIENGEWVSLIEFHSINPELVGTEVRSKLNAKKRMLNFADPSGNVEWKRIDDGTPGKLAGAWLITGRMRDGEMSKMTPGARRTMKILSGTRFQWIAYNVETKEFSGTGGGTYTTRDGKYTENIEFFSRDNSRVGASLTFDFSIDDGSWRHKGMSSKGDPIDEVWTRREKIGL